MATCCVEVRRKFVPSRGEYVFFRDGQEIAREIKDGEGNVRVEGDLPDGIVRTYYEDSSGNDTDVVFAEWHYQNGKLNGISKIYYEDGLLEEELDYLGGIVDRVVKKYYENGHLSYESILKNRNGCVSCKQSV